MSNVRNSAGSAVSDLFAAAGSIATGAASTITAFTGYADALSAHSEAYVAEVQAAATLRKLQASDKAAEEWAIDRAEEQELIAERVSKLKDNKSYAALLKKAQEALAANK